MKKIAIVTIVDFANYGNRLQNYAIQEILLELGYAPETVQISSRIKAQFQNFMRCYILRNGTTEGRKFNKKYISWSRYGFNDADRIKGYDYYIVGSDQVWNAQWWSREKEKMFLLKFAPDNAKMSFAASFGTNWIEDKYKSVFRDALCGFRAISVREESGVEIVKQITNQEPALLVDPTCLINQGKWQSISRAPKRFDSKDHYIVTYFLGDYTDRVDCDVEKYGKENHLIVYHLRGKKKNIFNIGPREFLFLISHAELVLTDSFHASVFSFLFQKPFLVYPRKGENSNMGSRLETFLHKFSVERKYVNSGFQNDIFECDYQIGYAQLNKERKKARKFIINALEQNDRTQDTLEFGED